ncbi:MAG: mechanosensitive ion channel family protein [SAR324 cluster bacterium]|nr:mechanosensitive ion channel family protein [SAR324 cluster bacterium]
MEELTVLQFLEYQLFDISLIQLVQAFGCIFGGFILRRILLIVFNKSIERARLSRFRYDHLFLESLSRPLGWIPLVAAIYFATVVLQLPLEPVNFQFFAASLFRASWILLAIWASIRLFSVICDIWSDVAAKTETKLDDQMVPIVRKSGRVFLIIVGIVLFLQNMGYSVGSLVASLGIGGAALALASKDTLANLFGSLVIFFDRPFQIGDWIEVKDIEGTVEDVGLRTIRIRTFANSLITIPNSFFTTSIINNWSQMQKRRIKMTIGLTYDTNAEQMQQALKEIRDLLLEDNNLHHDFFLINFVGFGAYSLDILVYCFTKTTVWKEHMDIQEAFLIKIMRKIEELELNFAFPTQTVHLGSTSSELRLPKHPDK